MYKWNLICDVTEYKSNEMIILKNENKIIHHNEIFIHTCTLFSQHKKFNWTTVLLQINLII